MGKCLQQCVDTCPAGPSPPPPPPSSTWNVCQGALTYTEDGVSKQAYIIDTPTDSDRGDGIKVHGSSLTVGHGPRLYFAHTCQESIHPDMFLTWNLLGKTLSYNVDMSKVGCGCNAAFYFVTMPSRVKTKCGDYYCDANAVCGSNCAELDIQEGNSHAWASTPHHAYDPKGCEKHPDNYGPGKAVDPARGPMNIQVTFASDGSTMTTNIKQNGQTVTITHDGSCGQSLRDIGTDMGKTGMVPTLSNWGSNHKSMDWLDGDVCGNEACNRGAFTISDIAITSRGGPSNVRRRRRRRRSDRPGLQEEDDVSEGDIDDDVLQV